MVKFRPRNKSIKTLMLGLVIFITISAIFYVFYNVRQNKMNMENLKKEYRISSAELSKRSSSVKVAKTLEGSNRNLDESKNEEIIKKTKLDTDFNFNKHDENLSRIKDDIIRSNEQQVIYNSDVYKPLTSNDTVIVIQVHNRLENLKYLVESLTNVKYINTSLVIFSHDFWDEDMNYFIRSISAFKVMQIFYPYTHQIYPFTYPGTDPRDCVKKQGDLNKQLPDDQKVNCLNINWPDLYGNYREVFYTQTKHHWWWKLFQIFEKTRELSSFRGQVLSLEEDHLVLPDILHVLKLLMKERDDNYKDHHILTVGKYESNAASTTNLMERSTWIGGWGYAFDRSIYNIIKECESDFCNYDDYNWDWTIHFLATTCAVNRFSMISATFSRILHISSCGTHYKKDNETCNITDQIIKAKKIIRKVFSGLFPESLTMRNSFTSVSKPSMPFGGWGDYRDIKLCKAFTNQTIIMDDLLKELQFLDVLPGKNA